MYAQRRAGILAVASVALFLLAPAVSLATAAPVAHGAVTHPSTSAYNRHGDLLITDQFNNRVIEVNPLTNAIVWSYGSNNVSLCNPGPHSVIAPNDAERLAGGLTLIAGTGTGSCADNRVLVVDQSGNTVWQYGKAGKTGNTSNLLNVPVFAIQLPNHDILITDQGNNRIIEVNLAKKIVWSYGPTGGPGALNAPNSAELLANGHVLIADELGNRVIEVNHAGKIVWQYSAGLNIVAFASRLPNGNTLIADAGNSRVVEVSGTNTTVWQYVTNSSVGSNSAPQPTGAIRLPGGYTVIADQFNNRVIVVNDSTGVITYQYGVTNVTGNGYDQLNAPYSANVVGSYLGQTHPPAKFH
ncbi:MAG: PQQ-binding-like beta-propeller repeat protein [Candidatus Lutacidiplasmatales archaeon]